MKRVYLLIFIIISWLVTLTNAQSSKQILSTEPMLSTNGVHAGEKFTVAVKVILVDPWHINSSTPTDPYVIPTKLTVRPSKGYSIESVEFPPHQLKKFAFSDEPLAVYEKQFVVMIQGKVPKSAVKSVALTGSLYYQGCSDEMCLAPDSSVFSLNIPILADTEIVGLTMSESDTKQDGEAETDDSRVFDVGESFAKKGIALTFLLIFLGGLALNLTPCVYPLIPITMSYFGGQKSDKKGKRFLMALFYVVGIAIVNSILGTLAALSGNLLGSLMTNPIVLIIIALILIVLALSMFGVYEFGLPGFLMNLGGPAKTGYLGSLIMGLTMGIVAAPCIGPFVIGLLTYVATTGNPALGFAMFFTLSIGLGLPFLFLAFFSSQIGKLPRSGEWMVGVRIIFGLILVGMAFYFVRPIIPEVIRQFVLTGYLICAGIYLAVFDHAGENARGFVSFKRLFAIAAIILGTWLIKPDASTPEKMKWQPYNENAFKTAVNSGKLVLIDFSADWCIPCKEMDQYTFSDAKVARLGDEFALFKVDLTSEVSAEVAQLKAKYEIRGVPTFLFVMPDGNEIRELRVVGFEKPEPFLEKMKKALSKTKQ
ncbi:MAG: thiol:disulfide interchange protein [Candidatus Marinimicrobia bacterium CG08_land_8_20_14_0_20_45_22]|nr:MAG: thiol:disulfide interchange protein [Candidatus Marinimicrobia bacterium CG08_land_8_20_14_0_20_45_22]